MDETPTVTGVRPALVVRAPGVANVLEDFRGLSETLVGSMKEIARVAEQRLSTFFLTVGTLVMLLAFASKLELGGVRLAALQPVEFVSALVFAALLFSGGFYLRLLQYRNEQAVGAELREAGFQLLEQARRDAQASAARTGEDARKLLGSAPPPSGASSI